MEICSGLAGLVWSWTPHSDLQLARLAQAHLVLGPVSDFLGLSDQKIPVVTDFYPDLS